MKGMSGRMILAIGAAIVMLAPGAALAKGTFKGTYGAEKFKSKKFVVLCAYTRSIGFFSIGGTQASKKKQKFATASGTGPDPTASTAVFPIVLTDDGAGFASGAGGAATTLPFWASQDDDVVVTLTGYKKGKIVGTVTGTLQPVQGDTGGVAIPVNATFSAKCTVQ